MRPAFSLGEAAVPPPYSSLAAAILGGVEKFPDGGFLYVDQDGRKQEVSYPETLEQAYRLVAGLRRDGMRAGDFLIITLTDAKDIVPALWATAIGGFSAVPFAQSAHPGAAGMSLSENLAFLREMLGGARILANETATPANPDPAVVGFKELVSVSGARDVKPIVGGAEDLRFSILTSGTTGRPRLVGLPDRAVLARWWPQLPDAAHARGFLSWSSFDHVMGLGLAMPNLPLKVHLDTRRFVAAPLSWLDALDSSGATHATMTNFGMSLVLQAVAENADRHWRLEHVRKIGIGAEAISSKICGRFLKCLAAFGLRQDALILGYGLSECGPVVGGGIPFLVDASESADTPPELDRPTAGHAVRIVGNSGYLLREGEVGCIEVRGPTMTSGYLGDEAATAALFTPDQWLRTGDLGSLRDGKLTVVGREKELIIVNARKYSCLDIETAVRERTDFREIYVAPLEAATEAEASGAGAPCAVFIVVDRPDELGPKAVADAVRAASAAAFRFAPRTVALVSGKDVPRTSLGKVRRLALPALLAELEAAGRVHHLMMGDLPKPSGIKDTKIEARIVRIWRELLRSEGEIDPDIDFFAAGGDSLLAVRMSFLIEDEFGVPVRPEQLPTKLSISELALFLSGRFPNTGTEIFDSSADVGLPDWLSTRLHSLLELWPGATTLPGGFIRRVGTMHQGIPVFWCMQSATEAMYFERSIGGRFPAYVMRSAVSLLDYDTPYAEVLVDRYVREIAEICPEGPVVVGGNCQGVIIALAIVRRLVSDGRDVRLLAAADCRFAEQCSVSPVPVPVVLFAAVGSKLNPYRYFHHPEIGLRGLAPHGLRLETINAGYGQIMIDSAMEDLANGLEAAIAWAAVRNPSDETAAVPSRPAGMYLRDISSPLKTLELKVGESLSLRVQLKNSSHVDWEPFERSGLMLANHWLSDRGEMLIWSDGHTPVWQRMKRREQVDMTLNIVAPNKPGSYLLEVDLVEEGVRWFSDVSSASLLIPVRVLSRSEEDAEATRRKWEAVSRSRIFRLHQRIRKLLGLPHLI